MVQDAIENGSARLSREGQFAGCRLVEHDSERKQIAACIHFLAQGLFWRHVGHRAERRS